MFHRYPVDCWRFYPDSGLALESWGRRSGFNCALLESFVGNRMNDIWNDFVAIFIKDKNHHEKYPNRIQENITSFTNGHLYGSKEIKNLMIPSEDQTAHTKLLEIIRSINKILNS